MISNVLLALSFAAIVLCILPFALWAFDVAPNPVGKSWEVVTATAIYWLGPLAAACYLFTLVVRLAGMQ